RRADRPRARHGDAHGAQPGDQHLPQARSAHPRSAARAARALVSLGVRTPSVIALLVAVVVHAEPAGKAPPDPVVLASPGVTGPNLTPEEQAYLSDFFANQLRLQGVKVVPPAEG